MNWTGIGWTAPDFTRVKWSGKEWNGLNWIDYIKMKWAGDKLDSTGLQYTELNGTVLRCADLDWTAFKWTGLDLASLNWTVWEYIYFGLNCTGLEWTNVDWSEVWPIRNSIWSDCYPGSVNVDFKVFWQWETLWFRFYPSVPMACFIWKDDPLILNNKQSWKQRTPLINIFV